MIIKIRFAIIIGVTLLLSFCMLGTNEKNILEQLNISSLTIYSDTANTYGFESQLNGNGYTCTCSLDEYVNLQDKSQIDGISFETTLSANEILSKTKAKILSEQTIIQGNKNIQIIYCFVEGLNKHIVIDGHKVNMQIVKCNGSTIVGFPIILGAY